MLPSMASQVDAAVLNGSPVDGAGVRCDQGSRNGLRYTFQANGDQTWVIFKLGVSGQPVVAQGKSSAIRAGSATNTITGQCSEVANGATHLVMTVNGVVVSSIYARNDTRTFGKGVKNFEPVVRASDEELQAIAQARGSAS